MKNLAIPFVGVIMVLTSCSPSPKENTPIVKITNPSAMQRAEVVTYVLPEGVKGNQIKIGGEIVPSEFVDLDNDGENDQVNVLVSLPPSTSTELVIETVESPKTSEKLTQAEISIKEGGEWTEEEYVGGEFVNLDFLRVPDQHTDHTYFIRYEGPGWESDKMGYRFYLDWRNGMDVFGKTKPEPVLQDVGQDGFDSYHELSDWGLDLLKVGKTLGLGSIGQFRNDTLFRFKETDSVTCAIAKNGLLESEIVTNYYGWKDGGVSTDLTSTIRIQAGSALTTHKLNFSTPLEGFCTGLVENEGEEYLDIIDGDYRIFATYGDFSLNNDKMGLAIIVENSSIQDEVSGAGSHVVLFNPEKELTYYFMAVWEKGINPISSMAEFELLLLKEATKLNQPLKIAVE
ncbi:DUF4861 domain-containing protein [Marinoscillum pacificum]|uniref:DUF4861 domain-containing protein n=1 Tax=Marinoscillum pacificum TaxID=392723 RepID=UPI002157CFD6|nr:DUF4861 domain-containing protein [Marinoscillum pacificum]